MILRLRFLLSQEWSTCERRFVSEFDIVVVAALRQVRFLPMQEWSCYERNLFADFILEIPVYAGMVCPAACTAVAAIV